MFKAVYEGKLDVYLTAPNSDTNAGTIVKLGTSGNVVPANSGDFPYGVLAQDVRDPKVNNFKLDSITHLAFYGQKVGVYFDGGLYMTDNIPSGNNVSVGDFLYVGSGGQFTKTAPASGSAFTQPVAQAETANNFSNGASKIRIRLLNI
jgi:hypothetical protein